MYIIYMYKCRREHAEKLSTLQSGLALTTGSSLFQPLLVKPDPIAVPLGAI